jgi:DNA polymerase III epsilon subunit-like protein
MRVLIFDTETNDKPTSYNKAEDNPDAYPYMVQIAGKIIEYPDNNPLNPKIVYTFNKYITPVRNEKEIVISEQALKVHGINLKHLYKIGEPIEDIVYFCQGIMNSVDLIVAHNFAFDRNVLAAEIIRKGFKPYAKKNARGFCTMRYSLPILKIPTKNSNNFKFPRLDDLYQYLFNQSMSTQYKAHDAMGDVDALCDIFIVLLAKDKKLYNWVFNPKDNEKLY